MLHPDRSAALVTVLIARAQLLRVHPLALGAFCVALLTSPSPLPPDRLAVDKPVVTVGGEFTIKGAPGLTVLIESPADKAPIKVVLDGQGEAKIRATPPARMLSILHADDPMSGVEVQIIDP